MLDAVLAVAPTIVVAGTGKNVGKTTTFNALRAAAARRGIVPSLTSLGRDGEGYDALDARPKPRITLPARTLVALPHGLLPRSPAFAILETGVATSLGAMVYARVMLRAGCEIGGPPTAAAMRAVIERMRELAPQPVFVDGAIDRIAALAGGDDAVILATGAESGTTVAAVAAGASDIVARLSLARFDPLRDGAAVEIDGVLDTAQAEALLAQPAGVTVVVRDPTRVVIRGALFRRVAAHTILRCRRTISIVALTTSPAGGRAALDPRELVSAVARATNRPVFDVLARLAA